jgi:hypothetical protein
MVAPFRVTDVDTKIQKMIAAHLVTNYQGEENPRVSQMLKFIPVQMEAVRRFKIVDRDEIVRIASLIETEGHCRDNSFVKVTFLCSNISVRHANFCLQYIAQVDKNAANPRAPVMLEWKVFHGRLIQVLAFSLWPDCPFQDATVPPRVHVVAIIAPVPKDLMRNCMGMPNYKGDKLQNPKILDLAGIQCVAGRIKDHDLWTLFDRGPAAPLLEAHKDILADFEE